MDLVTYQNFYILRRAKSVNWEILNFFFLVFSVWYLSFFMKVKYKKFLDFAS